MVSGSTVKGDASTLTGYLTNYQTAIEGLKPSWTGTSYDNFATQSSNFLSEYQAISQQMDAFGTACDLYLEYDNAKKNYDISVQNYNAAVTNNDPSAVSRYSQDMSTLKSNMDTLKQQIINYLSSAASPVLQATPLSTSVADSVSGSDTTTTAAVGRSAAASGAAAVGQAAADWAVGIANDDSYGYVSGGMGNGGYDCTQLVHAAYEAAGISLPNKGYVNNSNIVDYYTTMGFDWHPGTIDVNELQAGDVLVNTDHHAELYIGNGLKVGAHDNYDGGAGDSRGNEINIDEYHEYSNGGWHGYLRYTGNGENA